MRAVSYRAPAGGAGLKHRPHRRDRLLADAASEPGIRDPNWPELFWSSPGHGAVGGECTPDLGRGGPRRVTAARRERRARHVDPCENRIGGVGTHASWRKSRVSCAGEKW